MGLNIKNERVHRLAKEAARVTGQSQTGAIESALELLLRQLGADPDATRAADTMDAARRIAAEYQATPAAPPAIRHTEDLYDARTGLPR